MLHLASEAPRVLLAADMLGHESIIVALGQHLNERIAVPPEVLALAPYVEGRWLSEWLGGRTLGSDRSGCRVCLTVCTQA